MKQILITGVNSYVGNRLEEWLQQYPDKYKIDKISLREDTWKDHDFSLYDVVVHVAGIAHISTDPRMEELYDQVNRQLTIEVAKKAKTEDVQQFIFLSSIIVYGDQPTENGVINEETVPMPSNFYGRSKLAAEEGISRLEDDNFHIVTIRPPMIYGKGSRGNYPKLASFAKKSPIFPEFENKRSMLHIDHLSEFIRLMIKHEERGLFFPQNKEYVQTSEMVRLIAEVHDKRIYLTKLFNPFIRMLKNKIGIFNKVFGDLVYDQRMSEYGTCYRIHDIKTSIRYSECVK